MNATHRLAIAALLALVGGCLAGSLPSAAQAPDTGSKQPPYTMAEYNAYQAACSEKSPQQQIRLLDDFVSKYPGSALLGYVYQCYYQNYSAQKNFPKVIEHADRLVALGDKADVGMRYSALYARAFAFNNINWDDKKPETREAAAKARDAALLGLKTLDEIKKPDNMSQEEFDKQKLAPKILFNYTAANSARMAKSFKDAVDSYKATLALTPNEPATWSQLGISYLSLTPPNYLDGFWALAHSVALKGPTEAQVRKYLRSQIANYQGQSVCDSLLDAELNELVTLAGSSTDRPDSYKLASGSELDAARKDMNIASLVADLKAGGDKSKLSWLAACGLEFPDVPSKLFEVIPGTDAITLKVAFFTSEAEFDAAKEPDMEVKVVGQPAAAHVSKEVPVRFTGTLVSYDPPPNFMLHWDKAKVNPEDIPEEKKKPTPKRPARRPTAKRPPSS